MLSFHVFVRPENCFFAGPEYIQLHVRMTRQIQLTRQSIDEFIQSP